MEKTFHWELLFAMNSNSGVMDVFCHSWLRLGWGSAQMFAPVFWCIHPIALLSPWPPGCLKKQLGQQGNGNAAVLKCPLSSLPVPLPWPVCSFLAVSSDNSFYSQHALPRFFKDMAGQEQIDDGGGKGRWNWSAFSYQTVARRAGRRQGDPVLITVLPFQENSCNWIVSAYFCHHNCLW